VDTEHALKDAREIGEAATLMYAMLFALIIHLYRGDFSAANVQADELATLSNKKGLIWNALERLWMGCLLASTRDASKAVQTITSAIAVVRSRGSRLWRPTYLSHLARAYADLEQFDDAWRCVGEAFKAMGATKERWCEADVHRTAGEIALMASETNTTKAEAYFERALAVAHAQGARSWELRAAISMARLWRDQGKRLQAHDLLAPVYGWFTEGFDTLDLKEAKALLEQLKA
jgi:predicted ATPase